MVDLKILKGHFEIDWPLCNCLDIENSKIVQSFLNCYSTIDDSKMSNFKTPKTLISKNDQISFVYGSRIKTFKLKCYKAYRLWCYTFKNSWWKKNLDAIQNVRIGQILKNRHTVNQKWEFCSATSWWKFSIH